MAFGPQVLILLHLAKALHLSCVFPEHLILSAGNQSSQLRHRFSEHGFFPLFILRISGSLAFETHPNRTHLGLLLTVVFTDFTV